MQLCFRILQAIKSWRWVRPENKACVIHLPLLQTMANFPSTIALQCDQIQDRFQSGTVAHEECIVNRGTSACITGSRGVLLLSNLWRKLVRV